MNTKVITATLAQDATQFLAFKRAIGTGYRRAEFVLNSFVRFVRALDGERLAALDQAVKQWATRIEGRKAITVGNEFSVVRQLCLFRRHSDPYGFVPDQVVAPVKVSVFVPYIFSRDEVLALVSAATRHKVRNMLAIRDDLVAELRQYLQQREAVLAVSGADDPLTLFIRRDGSSLILREASGALRCLPRDLGLKPLRGRSGARPMPAPYIG